MIEINRRLLTCSNHFSSSPMNVTSALALSLSGGVGLTRHYSRIRTDLEVLRIL